WVDKIMFFLAPLLVGGTRAPSPLGGEGVAHLGDARRLRDVSVERVGEDILVTAYVVNGPTVGATWAAAAATPVAEAPTVSGRRGRSPCSPGS
ncbi:MAG: dihydrofolate reductase family protein, partial [Chloroflexi bacterium]|nr:dihydrofolate reductase family protein [Chloroflexota bacterium]